MGEIKEATIVGHNKWSDLNPLKLDDKDLVQVPWNKYYKDVYLKKQVILHHTVSGIGIAGDLKTWKDFEDHIATFVIIERNGTINQLFSSKYWGYHLGCGKSILDKHSIAIELDSWGQLKEKNGKLYTVYNSEVNVPIIRYDKPFRGEYIFEAYSEAQLVSLGKLLLLLNKNYNIPLIYNEDMWDVSQKALSGEPGIWAHVSFRPYPSEKNKWDVHPDPNLISLLKNISKNEILYNI
jgi:hypothetical protein